MIAIHEQRFIDIGKSARVRRRIDLGHDIHAIFFRVFLIRFIVFLGVDLIFWQPFIQLRIHFAFHPERCCLFAAIIIDVIAELFRCGIISPKGKFIREGDRVRHIVWPHRA